MPLLSPETLAVAEAIRDIGYCNPFLGERIEAERRALGPKFRERPGFISRRAELEQGHPNIPMIMTRAQAILESLPRERFDGTLSPDAPVLATLSDVALVMIYHRMMFEMDELIGGAGGQGGLFDRFTAAYESYLPNLHSRAELGHLFALLFQLRRAFHHIFFYIVGESMPAARLRAAVWQSIFTHDVRRYRRALYDRMGDISCLVTGPSGTGKELVARAVALSRYVPFNAASGKFSADLGTLFLPINLTALTPTLIESELFGHKRGAFTGAAADRAGWLETCPAAGTVFLDELGELDPALQVKLLRVLQTRRFQRIGESRDREFKGKVIAATNRDLAGEMRRRRFREDLYFRLCSDLIVTPSLREQIDDAPKELGALVLYLARQMAGDDEAPGLAREVMEWIETKMPADYPWPGNIRELEQCVRNVLVRNAYQTPYTTQAPDDPREALAEAVRTGRLNADELMSQYASMIYAETGSYKETARRLGVDQRTAKSRASYKIHTHPK